MLAFFAIAPDYHIHILSSHEMGTAGFEPASITDLFHYALPLSYVPVVVMPSLLEAVHGRRQVPV